MWLVTFILETDDMYNDYGSYRAVLSSKPPKTRYFLDLPENIVRSEDGSTTYRVTSKVSFSPDLNTTLEVTRYFVHEITEYERYGDSLVGDFVACKERGVEHLEGSKMNYMLYARMEYEDSTKTYMGRCVVMEDRTLEECKLGLTNWEPCLNGLALNVTDDEFIQDGVSLYQKSSGRELCSLRDDDNTTYRFISLVIESWKYPIPREIQ